MEKEIRNMEKIKFLPEWLKNILRNPLKVYITSIIIFSIAKIYIGDY